MSDEDDDDDEEDDVEEMDFERDCEFLLLLRRCLFLDGE